MYMYHVTCIVYMYMYMYMYGRRSPTHHLNHLEHTEQKAIIVASNNNGITLAQPLISKSSERYELCVICPAMEMVAREACA